MFSKLFERHRAMLVFLCLITVLAACGQPDEPVSPQSEPIPPSATPVVAPTQPPTAPAAAISQAATPVTNLPLVVREQPSPTPIPIPDPPGAWHQLGFDPQRTSYVPEQLGDTWQLKWIWNGPAPGSDNGPTADHLALPQAVQPVVGSGKLYVGHSDGLVRAINEADGTLAWATPVGGEVLNTAAYIPASRSVIVGTTQGRVVKLSADDGSITGAFSADAAIVMAPLVVNTTVYIGTLGGTFYAIDSQSMEQLWSYSAGAELRASPAYATRYGGLVIFPAEDTFVHAVQASTGERRWSVKIKADPDPQRGNRRFPDTYPVVSEANDVVILRSYFAWQRTWQPDGGAPADVEAARAFLTSNPDHQSFFVLELSDGRPRFVAPVLGGAIGNNDDYYSSPPQAVVKTLSDGTQVAYLLWRNRQACLISSCDGREDTTLGEMDLRTGAIRFVEAHKNAGSMRLPTDEQGVLSMAGDTILHSHWMLLGGVRITDRSEGLGGSFNNPIRSVELSPVGNTMSPSACSQRDPAQHYCPVGYTPPGDGSLIDPGFYIYRDNRRIYDLFWRPPVRNAVISNGAIYWRSVDGAIIALQGS